MKVLITGVSGFIGSHLTSALIAAGYEVVACARNSAAVKQRWPGIAVIESDFSRDHETADWLPRLQGVDVVVNAVGIIRETRTQTFEALHTAAPCALFRAAERAGVSKVIQISALGADETAFSRYHLSKRAADECLLGLNLNWAIVMPSIVYGPGAGSMAFFKAVAALPVVPLVEAGEQSVQPIHIDDFTQAVVQLITPDAPTKLRIAMVGPQPITIKIMFTRLRQWLGMSHIRFVRLPYGLASIAARLGGLMGNTPMTPETVQMLRKGNTGDVEPFVARFGFMPMSFDAALARTPAQQSDRWHAGLYFLRPLLRLSIAFVWIFTGVVSALFFPLQQSYAMLAEVGIAGIWGPVMLYSASTMDLLLGVATLVSYRLPLVALMQIAVMLIYTFIITFALPEQWLHPFGPVSKNLPLIVATIIMVVLERR